MSENPSHYDVFLSYASEDYDYARNLVKALKAKNISVWYDQGELRWGDSVLRGIEDALENSDFYLLLLSPEYFQKPWTAFEGGVALGRGGKKRILPVYLKQFESEQFKKLAPSIATTLGIDAEKFSLEEIATKITDVIKNYSKEKPNRISSPRIIADSDD